MCGIAGRLAAPGGRVDPAGPARAAAALRHRGPDGQGWLAWSEGAPARTGGDPADLPPARVALVHRRLAILDLTEASSQPMSSADGRLHLVFNGEIYNYRELREELQAAGAPFRTTGDTEVLLAALDRWGTAALPRLVGMFAFALLDLSRGVLLLARDPFGIKPLYVAQAADGGFAFCSQPAPLVSLAGIRPAAEPAALYDYLRFGVTDHGTRTLVAGVRQLPPATWMEVGLAGARAGEPVAYWRPEDAPALDLGPAEAASRFRDLFLESVRLHLRSDVPVGAALSGGLDSSSIVAAMRAVGGAGLDLHAVSYLADDPALSEERWLREAAASAGARVHEVRPSPGDLVADLDALVAAQEEPFGSTSIYAQFRVFRAASEAGLTVMLDGQGADELLGGYRPYLPARLLSLVRGGEWIRAWRFLRRAGTLPGASPASILAGAGPLVLPPALQGAARRLAGKPWAPPWMSEEWFRRRGVGRTSPFPRPAGRHALRALLRTTLGTTSLPMLLRYEDRNSMAFSIESRVPFLTPALADFLLGLPEEHLVDDAGTTKAVLRRGLRGLVPDAILERRDKIGFATPERAWLTALSPWVEATLGGEAARSVPVLDPAGALAEWEAVREGRRPFGWHVWRSINLVRWAERTGVEFR